MTWADRSYFPPLFVRILHKSKLRYYGKPDKKMIEPYQASLGVADSSGTASVIMWNTLCPEWYKSLRVGLVLLLQHYSVKKSYPFRMQPLPVDPQIKLISTIEKQVKPEWRLPKLNHHFTTRSELDDMPENHICDVIGILVFNANQPSTSQAAGKESQTQERRDKQHQDDPVSSQCFQAPRTSLSPTRKKSILQGPYAKPYTKFHNACWKI
ncbi:hypothetical protein MC885_016321 [Smutsia gigantea]|nr:hypothetical protein MC885_016321 [Smutsia gigantea]